MKRWLAAGLAASLAASLALGQDTAEERALIVWNELVQVAAAGRATDISFGTAGLEAITPSNMVWIADPRSPGIVAVATRPIQETAKAGEVMGKRGEELLRRTAALCVAPERTVALSESGRLFELKSGWVDSTRIARTLVTSADLDVSLPGLTYVLWGDSVKVFGELQAPPLWSFALDAGVLPAQALAVSSSGEIFVAGRGRQAVAVYDLDADGRFSLQRAAAAESLRVRAAGGIDLTPFMLLPVEDEGGLREAWVDLDRFVVVSDTEGGALVLLERKELRPIGRWDLRSEIPGAAPGRLDVSNRGQIAYVDARTGEAWALPTRVTVGLIQGAKVRWRIIAEPQSFRVQGGDTLELPRR